MATPFSPAAPAPGRSHGASMNGHGAPLPPPSDRLPRGRRRRRPGLAVGGALLVMLCGVSGAALATAGDSKLEVLALARDVQAGQVLTADDLRVAELSGSGLSALGADGAAAVVGQTVTVTAQAGTLLNPSMLTTAPLPGEGLQLVAVAVKAGGVPEEATPGRDVTLVRVVTAADGRSGTTPTVLVPKARLVSVRTDASTGLTVLSVQVPQSSAVAVAQASASGAVAVTLLPVAP